METEIQIKTNLNLQDMVDPDQIVVENFTFQYKNTEEPVLQDINLTFNKGEFILIMGQSGCGKSTLVQTLNGVIPHLLSGSLEGRVLSLGKDTKDTKPSQLAKEIGIVFQNPEVQLFALTVEDELAMVLENMGMDPVEMRSRVDWALDITGLQGMEMRQPAKLSGGQKQRVATAAVLTYHPSVLILDEPTAYLDNEGTVSLLKTVRNLVHQRELTIILVEHKIELVIDLVDRVIVMDKGRVLFDGTPTEVFSNVEVLRNLGVSLPRAISVGIKLKDYGMPLGILQPTIPGLARSIKELIPNNDIGLPINPETHLIEPAVGTRNPVIEFKNVSYVYDSGNIEALRNVSTTIYEGDFVALVGHNGSGKSTMLQQTVGILLPTEGEVLINGRSTRQMQVSDLAQTVGIVFQNPDHQIFNETIFDEIAYGPRNFGVPEEDIKTRVTEALELVDLPNTEMKDPENLSMGQRQRLAVGSILAMRPKLLALDEPTVGQDPAHLTRFMDMIRTWNQQGNTVIMITHDIDFAIEYANRVIVLAKGQIQADGRPEEIFRQFSLLEKAGIEPPAIARLMHWLYENNAPPVKTEQQTAEIITNSFQKLDERKIT